MVELTSNQENQEQKVEETKQPDNPSVENQQQKAPEPKPEEKKELKASDIYTKSIQDMKTQIEELQKTIEAKKHVINKAYDKAKLEEKRKEELAELVTSLQEHNNALEGRITAYDAHLLDEWNKWYEVQSGEVKAFCDLLPENLSVFEKMSMVSKASGTGLLKNKDVKVDSSKPVRPQTTQQQVQNQKKSFSNWAEGLKQQIVRNTEQSKK